MGPIELGEPWSSCFLSDLICALMVCSNVALLLFDTMMTSDETLRIEINQITDWYSRKYQRGMDSQALLEVREAEPGRPAGDFLDEVVWEGDAVVGLELVLPVLDVQRPLFLRRVVEQTVSAQRKGSVPVGMTG